MVGLRRWVFSKHMWFFLPFKTEHVESESNDSMLPSCIKVKEECSSCDDIDMQTKSNGVSSFDTTMENSTRIPDVTVSTQCLVCGETFANIMQYTHHLNVHLGKQEPTAIKNECTEHLHECLNCLEIFPTESDLAAHKTNCSELYKCAKCGKKCSSKNKLKMHMKYMCKSRKLDVYQKGSLICRLCKKSFLSKLNLIVHVNAVHHKLSCTLCGKTFASRTQLNDHITSVHDKQKPFSCTLCEKSFARKTNLTQHTGGVHNNSINCTLCSKFFCSKQALAEHIDVIHHKLKRFSCTLCDKSFAYDGTLSKHIKAVHNKAFSCKLSGKTFEEKYILTKHIDAVHHKKKPIPCKLCDTTFSSGTHLQEHIISVHDNLIPFWLMPKK